MLDRLRRGDWLTRGRVKAYARIFLAIETAALLALLLLGHGRLDPLGRPLGTDFISFYAAGEIAGSPAPADVYRPEFHAQLEQSIVGSAHIPYYAFYYPPVFLLVCILLAQLPYALALAAWLGATGWLYVVAVRGIFRQAGSLVPILAYPACFLNVGHGQNAFLSASLLALGTRVMPVRPFIGGALLGSLIFKPQLGLLVPVALAFGGVWRAFFGALTAAALLILASVLWFGADSWLEYFRILPEARAVFSSGGVGFEKMGSAFAAIRLLGGGVGAANLVQIVVTALCIAATAAVWRSSASYEARAATLVAASLVASPLVLDYDLTVAAVAAAWLLRRAAATEPLPWQSTLLAALFAAPLVSRPLGLVAHLPVCFAADAALLALALANTARNVTARGTPTQLPEMGAPGSVTRKAHRVPFLPLTSCQPYWG